MNYITQLETKCRAYQAEQKALVAGITELVAYLGSSKFNCGDELDGYVNVKDVIVRLSEASIAAHDAWMDIATPLIRREAKRSS